MNARVLLLSLFTISINLVYSQQRVYKFFTIKEGLPTNNIFKVRIDNKGFLWIAHDKGISKYDGYTFKHYYTPLQKSNAYTDLYVAPDGKIWMTNLGLQVFYIENDEMKLFRSFDMKYLPSTLRMGFLKNGNLIFNAEGGIIEHNVINKKERVLVKNSMIQFFHVFNDTIYYNNVKSGTFYKYHNGKTDSLKLNMNHSVIHVDEKCIISSNNSLKQLNVYYGPNYSYYTTVGLKYNYNYSELNGKYLYVYTTGDVVRVRLDDNAFTCSVVLENHSFTHSTRDKLGNEWFSTLNDGIIFIPSSRVNNIDLENDRRMIKLVQFNKKVYGMSQDNQFYELVNGTPQLRANLNEQFEHKPVIVFKNIYDRYLLIGNNKFYLLDTSLKIKRYINNLAMKDASLGDDDYLYMATTGNILFHKFTESQIDKIANESVFNTLDSSVRRLKINGRFTAVKYDTTSHTLYFGGIPGLYSKTQDGKVKEIRDRYQEIFPSFIDYNPPYVVVGTIQSGVYILKNGTVYRHFSNVNSTIGNNIIKIKLIHDYVWILSDKGMHSINLDDMDIQTFSYIGAVDLNNSSDFTISDNLLYLISSQKTYVVDLRELRKRPPLIPMYIRFISDGQTYFHEFDEAVFNHTSNSLIIGIESPATSVLGYVEYEYSLNRENWFRINKGQNEIYLTQLSPGNYTIYIRQIGNNKQYTASFRILKPYWNAWWFYLLLIIGAAGIIGYMYWNRIRNIRQKTKSEIEKFKLEKALQLNILSSIRSQMNPHFIFNALNTIQSYIYLNDKKQAINYLGKFSVLTRKILEESNKETISLAEEIETLKLYLDLEKMRFENILEFEISMENITSPDMFKIPPMLIQPYVENAVKHGLMHKSSNRHLNINFRYAAVEKVIQVRIEDNGIGRKRSREINAMKNAAHQSFSTRANKTRLDILNSDKSNPISVRIIDKTDEFNNPNGTLVQINIPVL